MKNLRTLLTNIPEKDLLNLYKEALDLLIDRPCNSQAEVVTIWFEVACRYVERQEKQIEKPIEELELVPNPLKGPFHGNS